VSTKAENITNPTSCWNKAGNDEPVFVLRANDSSAPDLIIMWANMYVSRRGWHLMSAEQQQKFRDALAVADAMRKWRIETIEDDIPF